MAEAYLAAIRGSTAALQEFAGALPKGADLHVHLTGAAYAEDAAQGAAAAGAWLCPSTLQVAAPPASAADNATCPGGWQPLAAALAAPNGTDVMQALVKAWSFETYAGSDPYWRVAGALGGRQRSGPPGAPAGAHMRGGAARAHTRRG